MVRLVKALVGLTRQPSLNAPPGSTEGEAAQAEMSVPLLALASDAEQSGERLIEEVAYLLKRHALGGPPITGFEENSYADKLDIWYQSSSSSYNALHKFAALRIDTLRKQPVMSASELTEALIASTRGTAEQSTNTAITADAQNALRSMIAQVWRQSILATIDSRTESRLDANQFHSLLQTPVHKLAESLTLLVPASDQTGSPDVRERGVRQARAINVDSGAANRVPAGATVTPGMAPASPETAVLLAKLSVWQSDRVAFRNNIPSAWVSIQAGSSQWFEDRFPDLTRKFGEGWPRRLVVRRWEENKDGQRVNLETALITELPWRAATGKATAMPFSNRENRCEILLLDARGGEAVAPPELNGFQAKWSIALKLEMQAKQTLVGWYAWRQDAFWEAPVEGGATFASVVRLMAGGSLQDEALLRARDGTLSAAGLKTVQEVLAPPKPGALPGVWRLVDGGRPVPGAFMLTQRNDLAGPGAVVLWRSGAGLSEFSSLEEMKSWLKAQDVTMGAITTPRVEGDVLDCWLKDLRDHMKTRFAQALAQGPAGETVTELQSRLDAAADAGPYLTLTPAFEARGDLLTQKLLDDWLNTTGREEAPGLRRDWLTLAAEKATVLAQEKNLIQPGRVGAQDVHAFARERLITLAKDKYGKNIDPDRITLDIPELTVPLNTPGAIRPSPFVGDKTRLTHDRRTMTQWSVDNLTLSRRFNAHVTATTNAELSPTGTQEGGSGDTLTPAQIIALVREADVAKAYQAHLQARWLTSEQGQAARAGFTRVMDVSMKEGVHRAVLNGRLLTPYREGNALWHRGLEMVLAALTSRTAEERLKVRGREVMVSQVYVLDKAVPGALMFGTKPPGSVVIYTPGAPDGIEFREGKNERDLFIRLMSVKGMGEYLAARVHVGGQPAATTHLAGKGRLASSLSVKEIAGDFMDATYEASVRTVVMDVSAHAVTNAKADWQSVESILRTAGTQILSMATPFLGPLSIPVALSRAGLHFALAGVAFQQGSTHDGVNELLEGFGALTEGAPTAAIVPVRRPVGRPTGQAARRPAGDDVSGGAQVAARRPSAHAVRRPGGDDAIRPAAELPGLGLRDVDRGVHMPGPGVLAVREWRALNVRSAEGLERTQHRGLWKVPGKQEYYQEIGGDFYRARLTGQGREIYREGDASHGRRVLERADGLLDVEPEGNRGSGGGGTIGRLTSLSRKVDVDMGSLLFSGISRNKRNDESPFLTKLNGRTIPVLFDLDKNSWVREDDGTYLRFDKISCLMAGVPTPPVAATAEQRTQALRDFKIAKVPSINTLKSVGQAPGAAEVPKNFEQIWIGSAEKLLEQQANVFNNSRLAQRNGYTFNINVLLDGDDLEVLNNLRSKFKEANIINMRESAEFKSFTKTKYYEVFETISSGPDANRASACDMYRLWLLDQKGGYYLDVDDRVVDGFFKEKHCVAKGNIIPSLVVSKKELSLSYDINNNFFGTRPENEMLREVLAEGYRKWAKNPSMYKRRPVISKGQNITQADFNSLNKYMSNIASTWGPKTLSAKFFAKNQEYESYRESISSMDSLKENKGVFSNQWRDWAVQARNDLFSASRKIEMGNNHSWLHSR
ncbi:dermonecrotic toxin domain-containing protein [Pseudomonas fluorescens]|uniref:dermonecrotic toxin domain-containing protein n=1 Tax=Pseudomonas fluorescens TaxID=294 RepID=UPI001BE502A2|nr:DUF6543 domain-containing protein [Pseudomonas fluorescens]MBT2375375.1 hypothetical protein [Pseudomonas fluorescens]